MSGLNFSTRRPWTPAPVENTTVFDELGGLAVDLAQGFALGKRVPLDSMIASAVAWGGERLRRESPPAKPQ